MKIIITVFLVIVGIGAAFWLLGIYAATLPPTTKWKQNLAKAILRIATFFVGMRVEVEGAENVPMFGGEKGYAVIANHQSNLDILVLAGFIKDPLGFMAKIEIQKWPVIGVWAKAIGCTFIDRKNLRQSYGIVMGETREHIKEGLAMTVFPAGTRSKSNEVLPFKAGAFKVATASDAPILPVTLVDVYKASNASLFKPVRVKMIVHPLITADTYKEMKSFDLAQMVQDIVEEPLHPKQ